jgi:peptide/nickel transport system substrate-binding protein
LIYRRFDEWRCGPVPKIQRVIWRIVPSAGNRRALLERGDADISFDLPPKDVAEMANDKKLTVVGSLIECALIYLSMNVTMAPFDKLKVRQAVAYAIPYQKIMDAAMFGRGKPMFGGPSEVTSPEWPQPALMSPILPRQSNCSPKPGCPTALRRHSPSISAMP